MISEDTSLISYVEVIIILLVMLKPFNAVFLVAVLIKTS